MKKLFVLDTNVILHDSGAIHNFQEHDIVIPITVLEELDKFKKGTEEINYNARTFVRELDKLAGQGLFDNGVSLGKKKGKLYIEPGKPFSDAMNMSFPENIPDHRILAVAEFFVHKYPKRKVALVTKDINLRMKAKSIGIPAEDYETDKVQDMDYVAKEGATEFLDIDTSIIQRFYDESEISADEVKLPTQPEGHEYYLLKNGSMGVLVHYNPILKLFERIEKEEVYGITPRNTEQTFAMHALLNTDVNLVTVTGKAGTGKTLLALAAALEQADKYDYIYLARPIVALSSKDLGYLPGTANEKIGPYMLPLFDNLAVIKNQFALHSKEVQKIEQMLDEEKLVITPLAYIRGRSLSNAYFIVDEAQNLTPHEVKTIVTRAGEGTKMVFTGDIDQIDSPFLDKRSNGLSYTADRMRGQEIFTHVNLVKGERSKLAEVASDLL
ncbi:PhoH-like ATPase [Balneicella halophila]|uniref:PhoH-like ATPase n=1 Tax=Balneicella halophila TaxID=1537566 RepID=A0A7L4URP1_BALHA|nr:PhoH family protein [Balneicella halophila]PVX52420.1 PhoH-like ATPase [Balneicella halophila]